MCLFALRNIQLSIASVPVCSVYLFFKIFFLGGAGEAGLGLHCYTGAFSSCSEQGLLIAMTSLVVEHRLSSCGSRACLVALLHMGSSQTRD